MENFVLFVKLEKLMWSFLLKSVFILFLKIKKALAKVSQTRSSWKIFTFAHWACLPKTFGWAAWPKEPIVFCFTRDFNQQLSKKAFKNPRWHASSWRELYWSTCHKFAEDIIARTMIQVHIRLSMKIKFEYFLLLTFMFITLIYLKKRMTFFQAF